MRASLLVVLGLSLAGCAVLDAVFARLGFVPAALDQHFDFGEVPAFVLPGACVTFLNPFPSVLTGDPLRFWDNENDSFTLDDPPDWLSVMTSRGPASFDTDRKLCATPDAPTVPDTRAAFTYIRYRIGVIVDGEIEFPVVSTGPFVRVRQTFQGTLLVSSTSLAVAPSATPPAITLPSDAVKLHANASGGTPPYVFSWTGPGGVSFSSPTSEDPTASNIRAPSTFTVTVTDALGDTASGSVSVAVHGLPTVTIAATDANTAETGPDPGTFTVSRTGPTTDPLIVHFAIGGTAANGTDYATIEPSVEIPAGAASAKVRIIPIDDRDVEGSETVVLTLSIDAAYTVGTPSSATVTIADGDIIVLPGADLAVTVADNPDPVRNNSLLIYTIAVSNNGPEAVTGVVLTDVLPVDVEISRTLPSQGSCQLSFPTIRCTLGTIAAGAAASVTVEAFPFNVGTLTNTATVTASEVDPNPLNNTATEHTTVTP